MYMRLTLEVRLEELEEEVVKGEGGKQGESDPHDKVA